MAILSAKKIFIGPTLVLFFFGVQSVEAAVTKRLTDLSNKHNLSSAATHGGAKAAAPELDGTDEICVFCHTPHGATAQTALWNRQDPGNMGLFPLYAGQLVIKGDYPGSPASATTNSGYGVDYPNGSSRMCLSCHDGNTANFGTVLNAPKTVGAIAMVNLDTFPAAATVDLAASHPISFFYNGAVLNDINQTDKNGKYQLPSLADVPLDSDNRMQCTTCHDPHDDNRSNPLIGLPFWRHNTAANATAAYDEVCADCHIASTTAPGHGL